MVDDFSLLLRLRLRALEQKDFDNHFLVLLSELTEVGELPKSWCEQRLEMLARDDLQEMVVVEDLSDARVCAAGTLVVENKFIHKCGRVGHLEDVVVHVGLRGKGLGSRIVERVLAVARQRGCYKVIVDCAERNVAFYEKCGFSRKDVQMARYFQVGSSPTAAQPLPTPPSFRTAVELGPFRARPLRAADRAAFLRLLEQLTTVGAVSEAAFSERLAQVEQRDREHVVVVERAADCAGKATDDDGACAAAPLVACGTLVIEHKFIHGGRSVGHIEDVVVDASGRGHGLGRLLVGRLVELAHDAGCYKSILNCSAQNVGFYERCGFEAKEVSMAQYLSSEPRPGAKAPKIAPAAPAP